MLSIAKLEGPVTRFLPLLSSKIASSGVSGRLTSAVAFTNFTFSRRSTASAGAASTPNSVSAPVPLIDRPGPVCGKFGSFISSIRKARMPLSSVRTVISTVCLVGA